MKGSFWNCFSSIHFHWQRIPPDLVKALCGKFVWQLLVQGGSKDNSPSKSPQGSGEQHQDFLKTLWRKQHFQPQQERSGWTLRKKWPKEPSSFFFWVFCFINLQTSNHLLPLRNQISAWFSLPVTKQKMLYVCPQSLLHGLQLCHLFWVLRLKKEELVHRRDAFDDMQAPEGSRPH